jgi:hypothetical protein
MLGLNLIHAGFLAAGLAAALPILIHLLFRQRTRTVSIGSVRFLHEVVKEHRRRRRVRQWLLLALRVLVAILLALLFCRPYLDRSHRIGLEQEVVFLLDRSASMQAGDASGETALTRGIAAIREQLSWLDDNVIVHLATWDSAGITEIPVEQLSSTTATAAATDFGLGLGWARDILSTSDRSTRRIVLVTDMQRSGLPRAPLDRLAENIELVVRDVGDPMPKNIAIESAEALRTELRPDSQVSVRVVVRNHGALTAKNLTATCEVESTSKESFTVEQKFNVAGRGNAVLEFALPLQRDGLYKGQVRLAVDDALSLDNSRWIAFEARHPDRVLLVDGQEGRSVFSNETYFLETALRLQTEGIEGQAGSFEPERIAWEAGEGFPRLDGYRAIVLANVRQLSDSDGERLEAFLRGGGSLLIFAGDQVTAESLSSLYQRGLLPGRVAAAPVQGRLRVERWDTKHSALACFSDPQQGDLRRLEFHRLLPLEALEQDSVELFGCGNLIAAAERRIGSGRCVYVGTSADRDWTELPRTPMYVPLMRQLAAYLTDQLSDRAAVIHRLVSKSDQTIGIAQAEDQAGRWMVTNIDPRESALGRITEEELRTLVGSQPSSTSVEELSLAGVELPEDSLRGDEIWTVLVWILFAVLAAETFLAGRIHA